MNKLAYMIAAIIVAPAAVAVATDSSIDSRAEEIRADLAGKLQQRTMGPAALQQPRAELAAAVDQLDQFLLTADPEVVQGWRDYLRWDDLLEQLQSEQPESEALRQVLLSFRRNRTGLDMDAFAAVRAALRNYIHTTDIVAAMSDKQQFERCLDKLSHSLASYERQPNYPDAYNIGRELFCIERSTSSSHQVIDEIRGRFHHPNVFGRASLRLLNRMLSRDVEEETAINQSRNGQTTRGRAYTQAQVEAELVRSADRAAINIRLVGTTRAPRTVTNQGPVTVYGSFHTNVNARKRVYMNQDGLSFQPTRANCNTSVRIHDIVADRRIVERIAWRRAPRMTPEAEAEASRTTGQRIGTQLDEQAEKALAEANNVFVNQFCIPNHRYGAFPALMRFSTTQDQLRMHVRAADRWQLAAPEAPPAIDPAHDLGFTFHESMIGNFAESVFGGKELTDEQWLTLMDVMTGSEPHALWVHDRTDRWAFTFADLRPIVARFGNETFTVTIRSKQITRAEYQERRPIELSATFRVTVTKEGPVLFREGDVAIRFLDGGQVSDDDQAFLNFVHRKFNAIMSKELYADGLVPPTGGSLAMLRLLQPKEYSFKNGWMFVGYQLVEKSED